MKISEVWIYPVKSCGGIRLPNGQPLQESGFRFDRQWMVVGEDGKFITQRERPELARIKLDLRDDDTMWMKTGESWEQLQGATGDRKRVQVWSYEGPGMIDGNSRLSEYLSDFLGQKSYLVTKAPNFNRWIPDREEPKKARILFSDSHPVLITTQRSLDDLNTRLETPISMDRFRANLVIDGDHKAFEEDTWARLKIGEVGFEMRKRCSRCTIITVDQAEGLRASPESLAVLAKYRRKMHRVYFGVYACIENEGVVREQDSVQVLSLRREEN